tara:strand:+ start:4699 stop:5322 length:624 start_codon:yes stop_codon:yes gene_type:complete
MEILKNTIYKTGVVLLIIVFIGLHSCISTSHMFDSYTEYNYAGLSKLQISNSKRLKGLNLAFKQYINEIDEVNTCLIVIQNEWSFINLNNFMSNIFFIKDYKLHKSYSFKDSNLNPIRIDSLTLSDPLLIDTYNIFYITNFIKENGIENIGKITETKNCAVGGGGIGSTTITLFDPELNVVESYFFNQQMICTDIEYLESLDKKDRD